MSTICSCSGGGGATIVAGVILKRQPLISTPVINEAASPSKSWHKARTFVVRVSPVNSYDNSSDFLKRTEQAWSISQQPRPVACSSCASKGHVECKWCGGTGFFVIGNNLLCEFPSRNTSCVVCAGKGSACCADCKGTGFRAKWLGKPPL